MKLIITKKTLKDYAIKNIENIKKIINMLKLELNNNNKEKIEQLYKELNKETENFAEEKKLDQNLKI